MIPADSHWLRIYADAHDRWQGRPLYEAIVARARAWRSRGRRSSPSR